MDGMQIVLIALVVAAGLIAALALALDVVERRRYEESLRTPHTAPGPRAYQGPEREQAGTVR